MWYVGWAFQVQPMFIHKYFWLKDESTLNILNLNSKENTLQIGIHLLSTNLNDVPIWIWQTNFFSFFFSHRIHLLNRNNSFSLFIRMESSTQKTSKWNEMEIFINIHEYASHSLVGYLNKIFRFGSKSARWLLVTCLFLIANEVIVRFVNIKYRLKSIPIVVR